jgi:L-fuculose-phosphate aldolase
MESTRENPLAIEIVEICSWMYQKGFIASSEGNVSACLGPDRLLVTPRGLHKGFLLPEQLVVTDFDGHQVSGDLAPSSELPLHLLVYRERPDVEAVVHAHPTMAIACSLVGISLVDGVVPEVITSLGAIPTASYATPGTAEAAEAIRAPIRQFDAIILARHGSVTVGKDLQEAYIKLEMLEHTAQILLLARLLGSVAPLPREEVARLLLAGGRNPADGTLLVRRKGRCVEQP